MTWQDKFYRKETLSFTVGDEVKVGVKIKEGDKERIQVFEGIVISKRGSGLDETFMVRKIAAGVGVERIFLLHSPAVAHIKVQRRGKVRRAKLFYLRDKVGKASKVKEKMITAERESVAISSSSAETTTVAVNETK